MLLLLDSSGAELVCALADEQGVFVEARHPTGTPQSRDIGGVAGAVLGELAAGDLRGVVVGLGPGTFIGTRVAVSYANGLAAAGGVALYGVNSLAAISAVHGASRSVVLRDAGRQQVYWYSAQPERCAIVNVNELSEELQRASCIKVILEASSSPSQKQQHHTDSIYAACSRAGALVSRCAGVPAEGLRRCMAVTASSDYIEPVYLRGFL